MRQKIIITIILLISIFTVNICVFANNHSRLNQLNDKIADIKAVLSHEQDKRSKYTNELKKTEIASGHILLRLEKTQSRLRQQQQLLQRLNRNTATYQNKLDNQREWLAQQIRAAYLIGRQPYLKLILNQSDAERINRILVYYRYISHDRLLAIQELQNTLSELQNNQQQIQTQTQVLQQLLRQQQQGRNKLERLKRNRHHVINQINTKIQTKSEKLDQLLGNKRLLEQTVYQLQRNATIRAPINQNFRQLKGRLSWPTKGRILPYFGTKIYQSELRWGGILIKAPEDLPVYAIAAGKVVFAKWLPGYGLLLIISHGHGYMTLYGRTHYLYKKPGDVLSKGDLIATVGNSGGYQQPALYFAIRRNAKPLNPVDWCANKT